MLKFRYLNQKKDLSVMKILPSFQFSKSYDQYNDILDQINLNYNINQTTMTIFHSIHFQRLSYIYNAIVSIMLCFIAMTSAHSSYGMGYYFLSISVIQICGPLSSGCENSICTRSIKDSEEN